MCVPEAVRQELDRLKTLDDGFHYRELARKTPRPLAGAFDLSRALRDRPLPQLVENLFIF
jgi:hypothetical protein